MGRPESAVEPPLPQQQQQSRRRLWRVCQVALVGALVVCAAGYYGGPIKMVPWPPGSSTAAPQEPVLTLREVYVQSTPKPPSALVALSVQGVAAGRAALRAWYDDQAAMARGHGYTFPFRMARWTRPRDPATVGQALLRGAASVLGGGARVGTDRQLTARHSIAFAVGDSGEAVRIAPGSDGSGARAAAGSIGGPDAVVAAGTSRMLHRVRDEYLRSAHGRRHSYWSDAPVRGLDVDSAGGAGKWDYYIEDGLLVPNVTHKPTLVHLARMAANAYQPTDSETWEGLGDRWNTHDSFGWAADGVRGHVFADAANETVVLSFKGTS
ncbi:putative lipase atg15, partial [Coemansia spiralis]